MSVDFCNGRYVHWQNMWSEQHQHHQEAKAGQLTMLWSLLSELDKVSSLKEQQRGTKAFSLLISGFGQRRRGGACQVSPTEPTECGSVLELNDFTCVTNRLACIQWHQKKNPLISFVFYFSTVAFKSPRQPPPAFLWDFSQTYCIEVSDALDTVLQWLMPPIETRWLELLFYSQPFKRASEAA